MPDAGLLVLLGPGAVAVIAGVVTVWVRQRHKRDDGNGEG